jgi:hypothetical protein
VVAAVVEQDTSMIARVFGRVALLRSNCLFKPYAKYTTGDQQMARTDLRPHTWKVQGEVPHEQYRCWIQHKNQANFRGEDYELTFEQYQDLWKYNWDMKGRSTHNYCLTRIDPEGAWTMDNVEVIDRIEHLRRQGLSRRGKRRTADGKYQ